MNQGGTADNTFCICSSLTDGKFLSRTFLFAKKSFDRSSKDFLIGITYFLFACEMLLMFCARLGCGSAAGILGGLKNELFTKL